MGVKVKEKLRAFGYFGGKYYWVEELFENFPKEYKHFVDVFCGSMILSLNHPADRIITANDIYDDIVNFFEVLRDHESELIHKLELTPYAKSEYERSYSRTKNNIENARRFFVRARQSFFGLGVQRESKGWHMCKEKSVTAKAETLTKWNNCIDRLSSVASKIRKDIQITNYDFRDCIMKLDFEGTFFYCDPPYPTMVRSGSKDYKHEFTNNDHLDLAEILNNIKGKAMISCYDNSLYNDLYKDWNKKYLRKKATAMRSKIVQEVIWFNYDVEVDTNLYNNDGKVL